MRLSVISPRMDVGRLVVRAAVEVAPETPITEAAATMRVQNVSSMLVGGPDAIVTERDFTRAWSEGTGGDDPVISIATRNPMTVDTGTPITEAAGKMLNRGVRHLVVVDGGSCVGVVSLRMVLAVLLQAAEPGVWLSELRVTLSQTPEFWLG
jgi:CBS domain-containing protein